MCYISNTSSLNIARGFRAAAPQETTEQHVGIHKSLGKGKAPKSAPAPNGKAAKSKGPAAVTGGRQPVHKAMASAKVARPALKNREIMTALRAKPAPAAPSKPLPAQVKTPAPVAPSKSAAVSFAASRPPAALSAHAPGPAVPIRPHPQPLEKKVHTMPPSAAKILKADKPELKAELKKKLDFRSQDWVVYPAHGVGRIVSVEENEVAGMKLELFVINFEKDKMTLRVPVAKAKAVGMRRLSSPDVVQNALATLKGRARIKRTMWSRRAQEYEQKIHSGDLISIAEVVRDLHRASGQPEQSYSERQLYEAAIGRLAREVAAVEKIDEDAAMKRLETALVKAAA
jgi:CarD family transcriptional regulator